MILMDLMSMFGDLDKRIENVQNKLASMGRDIESIRILMTIPGVDYYTSLAIYSEIGDITRFRDAEHLASYTGLVPNVDQSGSTAIYGHITRSGPSVLRFFLINASHTLVKMSKTFRGIYRRMMKRIGKNRAIVAIARKLSIVIIQHAFKG